MNLDLHLSPPVTPYRPALDIITKWCYTAIMDFIEIFIQGIVDIIIGFIEAIIGIF